MNTDTDGPRFGSPALGERTWTELAGGSPLLVVPLGSTEQHGPHLPLDTDTRIAVAVATRLAGRLAAGPGRDGPGVVVAPPLTVGASGEHAGFPGTLSIGGRVLEEALVELGRSADAFAGVVFVNGHGGNAVPLARAVERLRSEGRAALAVACGVPGGDAHAGRSETSMLLALAPHLVRLELAAAGNVAPWAELRDEVVSSGVAAVSPNGVLGDPAGASAEEGGMLLSAMVERMAAAVAEWTAQRSGWPDA